MDSCVLVMSVNTNWLQEGEGQYQNKLVEKELQHSVLNANIRWPTQALFKKRQKQHGPITHCDRSSSHMRDKLGKEKLGVQLC